MGLELELIQSDERHYAPFECVICQTLVDLDALVTTRCSHVFCRSCLVEWLSSSHHHQNHSSICPTCNQDLLYSNNRGGGIGGSMQIGPHNIMVLPLVQAQPLAHRLLKNILVKCPLSRRQGVACHWEGDYNDLQSHLLSATAHKACASSSDSEQTATPSKEAMEVNNDGNDNKTMIENSSGSINQSDPWKEAVATAAAIKEEANGKFETKRYDDARSLYSKAISVLQESKTSMMTMTMGDSNQEPTQLQQQQQQHEIDKLLSTLYANRAASHLSLGDCQECLNDCRIVQERLDSHNGKIYLRACRAAIQLGELSQATTWAEQGLTMAATLQQDNKGLAQGLLTKELAKARQMQDATSHAQQALEVHRYADAKSLYGQLLREAPSAIPFLLGAARADLGMGLTDSALRLTKRVLMKHPRSPVACWVRGQTLFLMGESAMGLKLIQEGLRLDPEAAEIRTSYRSFKKVKEWMDQAKQHMFRRHFKDVVELLTQCMDECAPTNSLPPKSPLFATLHTDRAEAYLRLKDYPNVLKDCAQVVYVQEDCIPAWMIRIQAHHGLEEHQTAMEEIQQLLQRFEQDERLRKAYERADFLLRKKRRVNYYELLGVSSIASVMEIKKAYKKKSLQYHPDRIPPTATEDEKKEAQLKFQLLGEGLEIMCDDFQRKLYDEGYDPAAIRERVEAANHAARRHRSGHFPHGGGHYHQ